MLTLPPPPKKIETGKNTRVNRGTPEKKAVPASQVKPVKLLLARKSDELFFVVTKSKKYPKSFFTQIFHNDVMRIQPTKLYNCICHLFYLNQ